MAQDSVRSALVDLIGRRVGSLIVVGKGKTIPEKGRLWKCRCDCGADYYATTGNLKAGNVKSCGCSRRADLTGKRFGRLVVLEVDAKTVGGGRGGPRIRWICKCDCGKTKSISANKLNSGNTYSCGCLRKEGTMQIEKGLAARHSVFSSYKRMAKRRNIDFMLSFDEFVSLTGQLCYYCGSGPLNKFKAKNGDFIYNGIDRVDNNMGYFTANCVPCCTNCNVAKRQLSVEDFFKLVRNIAIKHNLLTNVWCDCGVVS
jgi:hypothetical protein